MTDLTTTDQDAILHLSDNIGLLPIIIDGHTFAPNADGLWNLNEIHKGLTLADSKVPSEWNNAVQAELSNSGNIRNKAGRYGGTWATELGTIAYAMWVSVDFYLMVARAFILMRNDAVLQKRVALLALDKANDKLTTAIPKADLIDSRLRPAGPGVTWGDACKMAGIRNPKLAKEYLAARGAFTRAVDAFGDPTGSWRPKVAAFRAGHFKDAQHSRGNKEGWRVTGLGLARLQERAEEVNTAIDERNKRKALVKTAEKSSKVDRWGRTNRNELAL